MTPAQLFDVKDRVAVITGGASGLGLAYATALIDNGARVHLFDIDEAALAAARDELGGRDARVETHQVDVTNHPALNAAMQRVVAAEHALDIVFANAGITAGPGFLDAANGQRDEAGAIERIAPELWQRVIDTNLSAAFATFRAAVPAMKARGGGSLIATASIAGLRPTGVVGTPYMIAKAALLHLVKQAALELARWRIRVNAIVPGPFLTRITSPALKAAWEAALPLKRVATTDEIQGLALLLSSPASDYITGAHFVIDGGSMLGRAD